MRALAGEFRTAAHFSVTGAAPMNASHSTYDDFRSATLDPSKWVTSRRPLGENKFWDHYDPNTIVIGAIPWRMHRLMRAWPGHHSFFFP